MSYATKQSNTIQIHKEQHLWLIGDLKIHNYYSGSIGSDPLGSIE
ncbi:MAG TPA: hypothetical protein VFK40_02580 [Nitrososphaeraceae archaeon]|nr:hypothetical protein [Nitrososphaeraceae archaeon]